MLRSARGAALLVAALGAWVASAVASACSSFEGNDGANDAGSAEDAVVPSPEAAVPAPVPPPEPFDGSCDGGSELDGAAYFCDDFDHGISERWTGSLRIGNSTIGLDDAAAVSPPNALLVTAMNDAGGAASALYVDFAGDVRRIRCSFDVRVDAFDDAAYSLVVLRVDVVAAVPSPPAYSIYLVLRNGAATGSTAFVELGALRDGGDQVVFVSGPTVGAWGRVDLDLAFHGDGTGSATLRSAGVPAFTDLPLSPPTKLASVRWYGGVPTVDTTEAAAPVVERFDDEACLVER